MLTLREADLLARLFVCVSTLMFACWEQWLSPFVPYEFVRDRLGGGCPAIGEKPPSLAAATQGRLSYSLWPQPINQVPPKK